MLEYSMLWYKNVYETIQDEETEEMIMYNERSYQSSKKLIMINRWPERRMLGSLMQLPESIYRSTLYSDLFISTDCGPAATPAMLKD
jgi:hypothetical protein